jgi:hypothetical protein
MPDSQNNLEQKQVGGFTLSSFKTYFKALVSVVLAIKTRDTD